MDTTPYLFLNLRVGLNRVIGEATERFFEEQIALDSLHWEMETSHQPAQDQKDLRKVVTTNRPQRVRLIKAFDRASINLCQYMAKRQLFEAAKITMVKSLAWDDKPRPRIEMTLTKGYVESVNLVAQEGSDSVNVKETVTLSFSTIKILYYSDVASSTSNAATTFQMDMPSEIQ